MAETSIECGFCCNKLAQMKNPVELPCSHVHCLGCIKSFYEMEKVKRCPEEDCKKVVEVSLESLPPYGFKCDTCLKRKHERKRAICYCSDCNNYYCLPHQELHNELHVGHHMSPVSVPDVESKQKKEEKCDIHQEQTVSIGCRTCLEPFCAKCISGLSACKDGSPHKLMSLGEVVRELLTEDITEDKKEREVQLEDLFKQTSKAVDKHDEETEEGLKKVRETERDHLRAVKENYEQLERKWIEGRGKQKKELTDFLESEVLRKSKQIRDKKDVLKSKIKHAPRVELLRGFKALMTLQSQNLSEKLPQLISKGSIGLAPKAQSRDTELSLTSSPDVVVAVDKQNLILPKQMSHIVTKELPANPCSLHRQDGCLYVGMQNNNLAKIDRSHNVEESFITCSGPVWSVTVYKNRIYTLLGYFFLFAKFNATPATVCVYNMTGEQLAMWNVACKPKSCNLLALVSDELVIVDQLESRIAVFSLAGQLLRQVPCSLIGESHVFMSAVDSCSIIISDKSTSKVSRFNIIRGSVEWSVSVNSPLSVCSYGSKYLLVGRRNSKSIQIIDTVSGSLVSEITSEMMTGERVSGLQIFGSQLAVVDTEYKQIQWYDLSS